MTDDLSYDPTAYGEGHACVYDQIYADAFRTGDAVQFLTSAAGDGLLLDLGVGTGRLAIPLAAAGVAVHGLDASPAMLAELRSRSGANAVGAFEADMTDFMRTDRYQVIVCAVSTLFMLPDQDAQIRCLRCARDHLRPGGIVVVEAFVPDSARFDHNERTEVRRLDDNGAHVLVSRHEPSLQRIHNEHVLIDRSGVHRHAVTLRYSSPAELDLMARLAGLTLERRFGGWKNEPYDDTTTDHVSCYRTT